MEDVKAKLCEILDKNADKIAQIGTEIFENPELGFKEYKTSELAIKYLERVGYDIENGLSITGFKTSIGDKTKGVNICVFGELDAVPTIGHPNASKDSHGAHSCGHSSQMAIMCGVMEALKECGIDKDFAGCVTFIATPAEEYADLGFRRKLIDDGKIKYMSGKQDMIVNGVFDDVDMVISCHAMMGVSGMKAEFNTTLNGFMYKKVTYLGKAAHAGAWPSLGINALNGAIIGLFAVNAQRETFLEEDNIRVHGIITEGGTSINTVPEKVVVELYVRGASIDAVKKTDKKINRAFEAGAYAVGCKCEIENVPGYMPLKQCEDLSFVLKTNMNKLVGEKNTIEGQKSFASGDIGDLSVIKPVIQFGHSGFDGGIHCPDFKVLNPEMAYIIPAKAICMTIVDLLFDNCKLGKKIVEDNAVMLTRKEDYENIWLKTGGVSVFEGM